MFPGVVELALCFAALANFGIGLYVFLSSPHNPARQAFFLFVAGTSLWIGGFLLLRIKLDFAFDTITQFGGLMATLGLFLFAQLFPRPRPLPVRAWILYAPIAIALVGIVPWGFIVSDIRLLPGGGFEPIAGPLMPAWTLLIGAYIFASIWLFVAHYKVSRGKERMQLRYFFFGIGVSSLLAVLCDVLLPTALDVSDFNALGPLSSVLSVGMTAYSIVRYELMDIRIIVQRGAIYTFLLGLIALTYLAILAVVGHIVGEGEGEEVISSIAATIIGIFTVPFLDRYLRHATDKIFFKDTYDYAVALQSLSETVHMNTSFEELVRRTQENLTDTLRATHVEIMLPTVSGAFGSGHAKFEKEIEEYRVLHQRILVDAKEVGRIFVGEKRSGEYYRTEDKQLLRTFSLQAGTALARAHLYQQVQDYAVELEKKVVLRTHELQESQENQRQMMLDIAHGLQTPLTIFQTKIEKLKSMSQSLIEVGTLEQSVTNLSDFIENLLKLAQLENRTDGVLSERCSLSNMLEEIVEEVGTIGASHEIRVSSRIEPYVDVYADKKELRAAILNLAGNSIKYMRRESGGEISFELKRGGTNVLLSIRDNGIGIAAKDLPRIFDRFYRVDGSHPVPGGGLGLSISKKIIERHGGELTVQSELGEGTAMIVHLPRLKTLA